MKNALKIAKFEFVRIFRDWRLALIILSQPIVIGLIVGAMSYHDPQGVKVKLVNISDNQYANEFITELVKSDKLDITQSADYTFDDVKSGEFRAIIVSDIKDNQDDAGRITVYNAPTAGEIQIVVGLEVAKAAAQTSQSIARNRVQSDVTDAVAELKSELPDVVAAKIKTIEIKSESISGVDVETEYATSTTIHRYDYFASSMMILLMFLVVFNVSGTSITSERASGTFERLLVTPYTKSNIIIGKAITHFCIGLLVSIVGTLTMELVFGISLGNITLLSVLTIIAVAMSVCLGLLISAVTKSVVESVQMATYLFFISTLTCGMISPIENGLKIYTTTIKLLPFGYAIDASRRINLAGAGWNHVASDIYLLFGFFVLFLSLAIILLRREAR